MSTFTWDDGHYVLAVDVGGWVCRMIGIDETDGCEWYLRFLYGWLQNVDEMWVRV